MNEISLQPWLEVRIGEVSRCVVHALQMNRDYGKWGDKNLRPMFSGSGDSC
jgi:hypothetical protein